MARKKKATATQKAISSSEPRVTSLRQWGGINVLEKSPGWNPLESAFAEANQVDLQDNFLMVQNNCLCTLSKSIETRDDDILIASAPSGTEFTGVVCLQRDNLICAFSDGSIRVHVLGDDADSWTPVPVEDPDASGRSGAQWTEIGYYADTLICLSNEAECFIGALGTMTTEGVRSYRLVPEPTDAPTLSNKGDLKKGDVSRIQVCYVYTNVFGSTMRSPIAVSYVSASPVEWSAAQYMRVSGTAPAGYGITGVDVYFTMDDSTEFAFAGHVNLEDGGSWAYNWLGALADTSQWSNVSLEIPTENTTKGVNARHMTHIDGRLYFWGGDLEYRLWIGGNPGNELSVARGVGGAFVDIEPGTGTSVECVLKHKTYSASSIITVLCGNPNTEQVKRFNLLETNVTVTNELTSKGYMTEEVSNVVGCNSRWGAGVFEDGLYAVNRYGLALTTHAMEYNNQLKVGWVSDQIKPIFTDRLGKRLNNARLVYVDGIVHLVLGEEDSDNLDPVIFCYDIGAKAWWTYTYGTKEKILHVMAIDSQEFEEGCGVITPTRFALIPTTGPKLDTPPNFGTCYLETGELSVRLPPNESVWLEQVELDFDYFVGDIEIVVTGVDYYGRRFEVSKLVSYDTMVTNLQTWIRVGMIIRTYHIRIKGPARFRLFQILQKTYVQSSKINLVYGWDAVSEVRNHYDETGLDRHYLDSYNNLYHALVP